MGAFPAQGPIVSLQEEFSKVSKKMTDYQSEINRLNKSLTVQKRKLADAVSKDGAATVKKDEKKRWQDWQEETADIWGVGTVS